MANASTETSKIHKIIESNYPVLYAFGHNLLVITDPFGRIIGEMEGFATDKKGGTKYIGYWGTFKLKAYEFYEAYLYKADQSQKIIYEGTQEAVLKRWNAARDGKEAINKLDLHYPFLGMGRNSNSVVSTLIACMGLKEPHIPRAKWSPSKGCILLDHRTISEIRKKHGI